MHCSLLLNINIYNISYSLDKNSVTKVHHKMILANIFLEKRYEIFCIEALKSKPDNKYLSTVHKITPKYTVKQTTGKVIILFL